MAAATLCQLCQSIPLHDLPNLPQHYIKSSEDGLHELDGRPEHLSPTGTIPGPLGFPHHPDLESLRRASAAGCELCREIERGADGLLAAVMRHKSENPLAWSLVGDPTFDLWVTKRPEGGDGFWVVTKSSVEAEKFLYAIATFGLCTEDNNSPLASIFPGRPINGPPDSSVLDRISGWVAACDSHETCLGPDSTLPTRLLDVGGLDPETRVRLVEPAEGTQGRYTALSYCWGVKSKSYNITTSRSLASAREVGISIADLPQTFQDGIAMTRRLGVRYMWIDSLCICQDDVKDWERESSRMAAVYSNAYLTIAATGSSDADGGLFFDRPSRPYLRTAFGSPSEAIGGDMLIFPLDTSKDMERKSLVNMKGEPLTSRGWAFQERVLARRVLHFARDQICLECLDETVYEDGLSWPFRYHTIHDLANLGIKTYIRRAWYYLLIHYGNRKLTFPSDKMPALSGIAKVYADMLDDEYVAGIWRRYMIEEMCWAIGERPHPPYRPALEVDNDYRAPSWSWASVDGEIFVGYHGWGRWGHDVATVVDHHVEVDGDNPFGKVKGAWVKIEAPLVPLFLSDIPDEDGHTVLKTEHGGCSRLVQFDMIDPKYSVSADVVQEMRLFTLVLAAFPERPEPEDDVKLEGDVRLEDEVKPENKIREYLGLIVTPVGGGNGDVSMLGPMKRLGTVTFMRRDLEPGVLDSGSCRATVTLV